MTADPPDSRVPVTVLTGYLGSGKTTLLNRILTERHGHRIAVIENEFGEIGIDNELVVNANEEVFEMNNGCICCTVRGDLIRILGNLMKRRDRFDHILIETTGLADPAPVIQTFFVDDEVRELTRLDAVIAVVDSRHVAAHLDDSHECLEQIAFADVVVLNKTDLVDEATVAALEARVRGINTLARVHRAVRADVSIDALLSVGGFDLARAVELEPTFLTESDHEHDATVGSASVELHAELDEDLLTAWIGTLLRERGTDIFRSKGILAVRGRAERVVFQGVHMLFDMVPGAPWGDAPRTSRMVFIGRNLDRGVLEAGLRACCA